MKKADNLTQKDREELQEYLSAMKELEAEEPEYTIGDDESADAWEEWNKKCVDLNHKYKDIIVKALLYTLGDVIGDTEPQSVAAILDTLINGNIPKDDQSEQLSLFPEDEKQQRLKAEVLSALPRLQSLIPQKHLIPNNKLANNMTQDIIDAGLIEVDSSGKKRPGELVARCILTYEGDNITLSSRQPFTEYDRNVADAVTSIFEYGDSSHIVTAATVYRAMVHATETETPSPQQIGAVTKSLDKMRFVRVRIDCTEELKRRNVSLNGAQITNGKVDTYLLNLKKMEVSAGGQKVTAYKIMDTPILYDYARLVRQVLTIPAELLDIRDTTGAKVANTERRIVIKGYLLRRIEVMKGKTGKNQSRRILYQDAYNTVCETPPSEKEQRLIRDYIATALSHWKRRGYIANYTEVSKGRKKIGIDIALQKAGQSLGG